MKAQLLILKKYTKIVLSGVLIITGVMLGAKALAVCYSSTNPDCPQNYPGYPNCLSMANDGTTYQALGNAVEGAGASQTVTTSCICTYEGNGCPSSLSGSPECYGNYYGSCP
jgi:hypothetical protein